MTLASLLWGGICIAAAVIGAGIEVVKHYIQTRQ